MEISAEGFSLSGRLKNAFIGKAKAIQDKGIFHKLTLIAFFAWIGLGADGISSSCYGPEEAFRNLQGHPSLAIFVALGTVFTIIIINSGYNQIVRFFPHGHFKRFSCIAGGSLFHIVKEIRPRLSGAAFFGSQLVFSKTFYLSKLLHNHTIFSIQKRFFNFGIPIVIFPIKVD
ncbi:MAG: hypothetical protein ABSA76_05505 [Bacteroidales bacterium]